MLRPTQSSYQRTGNTQGVTDLPQKLQQAQMVGDIEYAKTFYMESIFLQPKIRKSSVWYEGKYFQCKMVFPYSISPTINLCLLQQLK
ncbi:hypothetical protein RDI58_001208 [Solanum bulbocastanum]|uniref:Uncharacterized protein n=1 Tax=Solanum bulbocastanum TaxID=147425 RepID=A0AAN8U4P5_SOLBU